MLDVDKTNFEKMMKKFEVKVKVKEKPIVLDGVAAFANTASIYTPPSMYNKKNNPSKDIAEKFYFREIFYVPQVLIDKTKKIYQQGLDEEQVRLKNFWKVKHYRWYNKKTVWKYFKSRSEAEKDAKIKLRGLMRVSWGMSLLKFGEKIPSNIKRLFRKCPLLNGYGRFSDLKLIITKEKTKASLSNLFTPSQNFNPIAIKMGEKASANKIRSELKKVIIELEK